MRLPIPASPLLEHRLELRHHRVVLTEEHRVARRLREPVDVHPPQHVNGILAGQSPQRPVEALKQSARFLVPGPPQVIREALEASDSRRKLCLTRVVHSPAALNRFADIGGSGPRRTLDARPGGRRRFARLPARSCDSEGEYARCVPRSCRGGPRCWRSGA